MGSEAPQPWVLILNSTYYQPQLPPLRTQEEEYSVPDEHLVVCDRQKALLAFSPFPSCQIFSSPFFIPGFPFPCLDLHFQAVHSIPTPPPHNGQILLIFTISVSDAINRQPSLMPPSTRYHFTSLSPRHVSSPLTIKYSSLCTLKYLIE